MAWVTVGKIASATDAFVADLVSRSTATRAEVDKRIGSRAAVEVAAAVANDQTVKDAAVAAMSDAAVQARLAWLKPRLVTGDADSLVGATNAGITPVGSAVTNIPVALPGWIEATFDTGTSRTRQEYRATDPAQKASWVRTHSGGVFTAWEKFDPTPFYRGALPDGADWNTYRGGSTNGAWLFTVPQLSGFLGDLPPVTYQGTLQVDSQHSWQTTQKVFEDHTGRVFLRSMTNPSGPVWTAWTQLARMADIPSGGGGGWSTLSLSQDWLHVGDSLTDDVVLGAEQWGRYMGTLDGRAHEIRGWYNQETFEIAARMGAVRYPLTVPGGSIPASGSTTVVGSRTDQIAFGGYAALKTRKVPGWVAGRHGYLTNPDNTAQMQFTVDDGAAAATPVTGTQWFQGDLDQYLNRITTIWAGTNDRGEKSIDYLVGLVRAMVKRIPHGRFFVFTLFSDPNGVYTAVSKEISDAYRAAFAGNIFDPLAALLDPQAETDSGLTFTADDLTDRANGHVPRSLRSDSIHLNDQGGIALAHAVHREAVARGWSI